MPFCPSGVSGPRPGAADNVVLSALALSTILPAGAVWLEPFIGAAASLINIHLPTFCAVDPPADPGLTGADVLSLVTLGPGPLTQAATDRFNQLMERYAWWAFCQCLTSTTPATPTFPTAPSGLPALDPLPVAGPRGTPCATFPFEMCILLNGAANGPIWTLPPNGTLYHLVIDSVTGASSCGTNGPDMSLTATHVGGFNGYTITSLVQAGQLFDLPPVFSPDVTIQLSIGHHLTPCGPVCVSGHMDIYCGTARPGGDGTALQTPCCPPDPVLTGMVTQILQMVTLIQRNAVPFAYQSGASHAGLTGTGTLTIPSCIGLLVTLTTVPGYTGVELGSPNELFDIGWFSWGNSAGYTERIFIAKNPQLSFPATAEQFTRVGYSLNPGVVATFQELYAEA